MADELELFNAHQEDLRRRADSLVRAIFILAGGALTVSIGFFASVSHPELSQISTRILQASWWCLFLSIIILASALVTIIARDYAFGEQWRRKIDGQTQEAANSPSWREVVIWLFAIIGFGAFMVGMLGLAYVASSVVSNA